MVHDPTPRNFTVALHKSIRHAHIPQVGHTAIAVSFNACTACGHVAPIERRNNIAHAAVGEAIEVPLLSQYFHQIHVLGIAEPGAARSTIDP